MILLNLVTGTKKFMADSMFKQMIKPKIEFNQLLLFRIFHPNSTEIEISHIIWQWLNKLDQR